MNILENKVDVYKENERFDTLLQEYYATRDDSLLKDLSSIVFNCSANVLKKRFGSWWDSEKLIDKTVEMTDIIMRRIQNFEKWPNGYVIKNLPTVCKFAIFNVAQTKEIRQEELELSLDDKNVAMAIDYATLNAYELAYSNGCTFEDEICNRLDEEIEAYGSIQKSL